MKITFGKDATEEEKIITIKYINAMSRTATIFSGKSLIYDRLIQNRTGIFLRKKIIKIFHKILNFKYLIPEEGDRVSDFVKFLTDAYNELNILFAEFEKLFIKLYALKFAKPEEFLEISEIITKYKKVSFEVVKFRFKKGMSEMENVKFVLKQEYKTEDANLKK